MNQDQNTGIDGASKNRKHFLVPLLWSAGIPLTVLPLLDWAAVSRHGDQSWLWLALPFVLVATVAVVVLNVALVGLAFARTRRIAIIVALCCVAYGVAVIAGARIGKRVRMYGFARLAERSKPVISAIRAYELKYGAAPKTLDALVPEYLPAIPSTGMGAYPEYKYKSGTNCYGGNPWILYVFTPGGGINFDQFLFFPLTNYPQQGFGGWLERIGDWAYVHE